MMGTVLGLALGQGFFDQRQGVVEPALAVKLSDLGKRCVEIV
jgi:hypothetical protein